MDPQETLPIDPEAIRGIWEFLSSEGAILWREAMRPWTLYQIGIVIGLFLLAWAMRAALQPRYAEWLRARDNWPKWRLRIGLIVQRRMRMILFVAMIWVVYLVMKELTWNSRTVLLRVVANLSTAWLFIAFATRIGRFDLAAQVGAPDTAQLDSALDRIAMIEGVRGIETLVQLTTKVDRRW